MKGNIGKWKPDKVTCLKKTFFVKVEAIPILAFPFSFTSPASYRYAHEPEEKGASVEWRKGFPAEMANEITRGRERPVNC